jgi:hypothetical protein
MPLSFLVGIEAVVDVLPPQECCVEIGAILASTSAMAVRGPSMILRHNGHGLWSAGRGGHSAALLVPSVALFPNGDCLVLRSLPTTQRCKLASAGNGVFNTSRIYGQPSRGPV